MRGTYLGGDLKLFKINKAKPLQLKRNLYIEKYIDNFLSDDKNQEKIKKPKISKNEENKENDYIRKTMIPQQKISFQENDDTQSTTMILNSLNKTEKSIKNANNFPKKIRTMSGTRVYRNITSNISIYKKNISNDCFAKNTSNIKKTKSYNKKFINKYDRKSINDFINEKNNISINQNFNDSFSQTKKLKRESTFSKFYYDKNKVGKHNRFFSNNSICTTMEKTLTNNNNIKNDFSNSTTKRKIHKEINIEDFLLIEKKFETLRNFFSNLNNKNIDEKELINSINFHIYDLYKFYLNSSIEGFPENMFSSMKSKKILHEYSLLFIYSLGTIFVSNLFNFAQNKSIILLNIQHKSFLLFCDAILKKLNSKYNNNIWVNKLLNELNNKLIFNIYDHLHQIRLLTQNSFQLVNDILNSLRIYINGNYYINNNIEQTQIFTTLYDNFISKSLINFESLNVNALEELFNKNIFMHENKLSKSNILKDINCINNEYYNINNQEETDTKVPYLKFPCKKEYTLILDLDETLICFKSSNADENIGNIHIRPGLEIFLEIIKEFYEIIIFTVGTREYANIILDLIEKKNNMKYFDGRLYREHATKIGNKYIKDLSKIGRDLSKTLIVDNNPHSFKLQHENGILISSYFGEKNNDKALIELQKVLIKIYKEKRDVRESIAKYKEEIIQKISCSNDAQ